MDKVDLDMYSNFLRLESLVACNWYESCRCYIGSFCATTKPEKLGNALAWLLGPQNRCGGFDWAKKQVRNQVAHALPWSDGGIASHRGLDLQVPSLPQALQSLPLGPLPASAGYYLPPKDNAEGSV